MADRIKAALEAAKKYRPIRRRGERVMNLLEAIKVAHNTKSHTPNVIHHSGFSSWDSEKDTGWQDYKAARNYIARYPRVEAMLKIFNII